MANSDIIKIGFDYRASLAQFEKETNGVFDGISNKAGKQKITIQLDAKDDKVIDKIKELQKLKLDKFTFEFGDSGLKEQLQTFDKLENKINEIINLGKGKSFIDSSSTVADIGKIVQNTNNQAKAIDKVTNSYKNQAYELASVLKMLAKLDQYGDAPYAEAFSKAVKSSAKSYKNGNDIQFAAKKYGMDEESIKYLRGLSVNLSNAFNYTDTLGLDTANITNVEKLTEYFRELLKEKLEFNNTKLNTSDIEELIKALGIVKKELFDDGTKSGRNIYGDGTLDKYSDLPQIIQYLKQQETQAIATAEAEQKLAIAQKETVSNTSNSNNSQIEELKSDIQEVKTELGDVKDRISSIESNGFENVRDDVEKTKESVKELNSELTEMKSNISSTPQKTNISSGMKDAFPNANTKLDEVVTSAKDLDKTLEQVDIPTDSFDKVLEKLDRTKSELVDIVKITKQSVSDADGKFHDSYTLKDSRGSTEIYGVNSKTDKGQILRQNIVGYDKKKDELDISKAQLEVDKQLAKEEDNLAKAQQKKAQAFLKEQANYEEDQKKAELIKRQTLAYEELTDTISKYSEVAKRIAGGNAEDGDLELMTKLEDKISQLQKQPILSDSQVSKSEKSLVSLYDQLDKIERKLVETNQKSQDKQIIGFDKRLESYTKKTSGYNATIARFNDGGWTSDIYLKNVQAVKDAVKQYEDLLSDIKAKGGIASEDDIQKLKEYESEIKNTIATVTNMSTAEKGYSQLAGQKEIDKINKILRENSAMSSEAKAKIKAYKQELISGNPSVSLEKIHGEIMKIVNAEELAGRAGRSMFDVIKEKAFYGFVTQIGMYFGFNDIVNGFKQVASTVIDLNTQITDLAKVSEATSSQIYDDFSSYADIAKDIGGTISDTISATADWSRNGYNLPDSKELARVALLYKNVGDGIDIDTANESLISTLRGFKMEADEAEKIIDIFNNVSNNEPIDSGGIGEALQRSAASFNAANTSLQESVALISTTNSVIQNPEKVGNMWKVVSMRIRSATSELEQAGEDTDGLVTSTADLQKMIKAMTGYDILESDGKTFKSIYDIVLNISKVWNNLSDLDQSSLLQALAGVTTKMFARIYRNINHRIYLIARVA